MNIPDKFPAVLAAAAMGVYLLVVVGATTSLTEAATACGGWPACGNGAALPTATEGWIALGHRVLAVVVGLLVALSAALAWRDGADRRVRAALSVALVVYPAQAGVGALVAVGDLPAALGSAHLLLGVGIFGTVLAALAWWLETETGAPDDAPEGFEPGTDHLPPVEDAPEPDIPSATLPRLKATVAAYFRLMKPRLMWLLCLVAAAAMALAEPVATGGGPGFTPYVVAATLVGGALSIGASGTFNHVFERDVDKRMQRTSDRPLATDLVPVSHALAFGGSLALVSLALFWTVNPLTAALGLVAIAFYSVVYTLVLKPNTVQNTVIGGAAGALPALIGWAAVTGEVGGGGVLLAAVIFLWTPAHFYNLALAYKDDYERGGFPMMPVVRGETTTRRHILWYLGATLVAAVALAAAADPLGALYAVVGVGVGAVFLWTVVQLHYEQTEGAAFRAFHASNAYLGLLLFAVVFDSLMV